jgi:hypothetical protein
MVKIGHLFPFGLSRKSIGTFRQSMIEFLQTDIDRSLVLEFPLNPVITDQLEKYLKTFYTPPLDTIKISFTWDQHLQHHKNCSGCR